MTNKLPCVGITMGDPAGIGPEVVVKALDDGGVFEVARPLVIGDAGVILRTAEMLEARLKVRPVKWPGEIENGRGILQVLDLENVNARTLRIGEVQAQTGRAAFQYVQRAVELALAGAIDAIATAPLNKEALRQGGVSCVDHTEMLSELTNCRDLLTMFAVRQMKIFFVTRHVSLRGACGDLTVDGVFATLSRADAALRRFGWLDSRLAVAALNPHGGEGGLFGDEEETVLKPAIARARQKGINVSGPIPADAVFSQCLRGDHDAVVSLYHDQGHIAAKTFDFERTVSVTTGLPFVRTSVDHGTAFDIAGKGEASSVSMQEAIRVAAEYTLRMRGIESTAGS